MSGDRRTPLGAEDPDPAPVPPPAPGRVGFARRLAEPWRARGKGLSIAVLIALSAAFLAEHYGAPAMLLAILIGLALHFLSEDPRNRVGLDYAAKGLLRFGIALLGLRISLTMFADLGLPVLTLLVGAVALTIAVGLLAARLAGRDGRFGVLTGGAVAICGASAAMAIAAALPRREGTEAERDMVFTVFGVTLLSTLAMIGYPILAHALGFDDHRIGILLGATIHDVAQVVGAGFSVSEEAGKTAVLVKLIRVALLAPVVLLVALAFRRGLPASSARPPLIPGFVLVFLGLVAVNSAVAIPPAVTEAATAVSRWALLAAIAAVGVKTSLREMVGVGHRSFGVLLAETVFLAALVSAALLAGVV
jgi:uncharacterized integral membrane protein (TIGR00698 family)